MIIMSGWPGAGKSYLAKKMRDYLTITRPKNNIQLLSTDDYWYLNNPEVYDFDRTKIGVAHKWNQERALQAAISNHVIIIDNTNIKWKELIPYLEIAKHFSYFVYQMIPRTSWMNDANECFIRNIHGVPIDVIRRMQFDFQGDVNHKIQEYLLHENATSDK